MRAGSAQSQILKACLRELKESGGDGSAASLRASFEGHFQKKRKLKIKQLAMSFRRKKTAIIGSGFVGSSLAHWLAVKGISDIALIDKNEGLAKGRALDLSQAMALWGEDILIEGGGDYALTEGADIVVITAGLARRPGLSRTDLLLKNAAVMRDICSHLKGLPQAEAVFIIVSNPLDAMVFAAYKFLKPRREKILGMAGVLDTARFQFFIAKELGVSPKTVSASILGSHGDSMVPLSRFASVGGQPLTGALSKDALKRLEERARHGGGEIVSLLKTGSAFFAPGLSAALMAEAILKDSKAILPCAALLQGEYGENDVFAGVPCVLGSHGLEKIIELPLNEEESRLFKKSAAHVRELVSQLKL